jgi:hypothetical protein
MEVVRVMPKGMLMRPRRLRTCAPTIVLGLELCAPIAERVERNPASPAILRLIELAWYPGLIKRTPIIT